MELTEEDPIHAFDAFYIAFEDRFRGSYEEIQKRLTAYLPVIDRVKVLPGDLPFLDIGCGRGEWLGLLKEQGCAGRGVDTNRVGIARCRDLGFDVVESDALEYLRSQNTGSFAAVTGFHLVEHLPFDVLMHVLQEAFRVVQPGGAVIFETPDPDNLNVSTRNFYVDPTHRNPIPDVTLAFIVEYTGFEHVQIMKLQKPKPPKTYNSHLQKIFNLFFTSYDYAVTAYKPT